MSYSSEANGRSGGQEVQREIKEEKMRRRWYLQKPVNQSGPITFIFGIKPRKYRPLLLLLLHQSILMMSLRLRLPFSPLTVPSEHLWYMNLHAAVHLISAYEYRVVWYGRTNAAKSIKLDRDAIA